MSTGDLGLLPPRLAAQSLSQSEIVLPMPQVLEALEHLHAGGYAVFCWEGWLRFPNGTFGHSAKHQGLVPISRRVFECQQDFARRAADVVRATITEAQAEWMADPETDATLCFCLSITDSGP